MMPLPEGTPIAKRSVLCVQPKQDFHPALRPSLSQFHLTIVPSTREALSALNSRPFEAYVLDFLAARLGWRKPLP
jgi:hypothetical protein